MRDLDSNTYGPRRTSGEAEQADVDSLDVLEEHWYIPVHRTFGAGIDGAFSLTALGLDEYVRNFIDGYDAL